MAAFCLMKIYIQSNHLLANFDRFMELNSVSIDPSEALFQFCPGFVRKHAQRPMFELLCQCCGVIQGNLMVLL
jgi:hypothetical protein